MRRPWLLALSPLLGLAALAGCGQQDDVAAVASPSARPSGFGEFSPETVEKMRAAGTTIRSADEQGPPPKIGRERAVRLAGANFPVGDHGAVQAEYGLVANSIMGSAPDGEDERSPNFRRTMDGRSMWVVLFPDVRMHVPFGGRESRGAHYESGDFLVYVDAATGEIPRAETLS